MSKIKLILLDIDGTILPDGGHISNYTKYIIKEVISRGIKIGIATGRMLSSTKIIAQEAGINGIIAAYQGALIYDSVANKVLQHLPLSMSLAKEVLKYLYDHHYHPQVYIDDHLYVTAMDENVYDYSKYRSVQPQVVGNLVHFLNDSPTKILGIGRDVEAAYRLKTYLVDKYNGRLNSCISHKSYCEVLNPLVSKGQAMYTIAEYYGIDIENVMTIGDQDNDMDMVELAGLGIAMGNGIEELKKVAKYVTSPVEKDGAAHAIEQFALLNNEL